MEINIIIITEINIYDYLFLYLIAAFLAIDIKSTANNG